VAGWLLESTLGQAFGFSFGFALLPVNGLLTVLGLWATSWKT
jgi:hypothetical protein